MLLCVPRPCSASTVGQWISPCFVHAGKLEGPRKRFPEQRGGAGVLTFLWMKGGMFSGLFRCWKQGEG